MTQTLASVVAKVAEAGVAKAANPSKPVELVTVKKYYSARRGGIMMGDLIVRPDLNGFFADPTQELKAGYADAVARGLMEHKEVQVPKEG